MTTISFEHEPEDDGLWDDWEPDCEYEDDWYEDREPPKLEFGGRYYPRDDVQSARALRQGV